MFKIGHVNEARVSMCEASFEQKSGVKLLFEHVEPSLPQK